LDIPEIFTYLGMGILYIVTGIVMVIKYILLYLVKFADRVYNLGKINYGICSECYTKYTSPIYVCPKCGNGYNNLSPSIKGIFSIKCSCSWKLPVTAWGRRKLKTLCPECKHTVSIAKEHILAIPVIGGENSGKTTFINNLNSSTAALNKVMLFDTLGSEFTNSDKLKKYKYYSYNNGFVFIIDSFFMINSLEEKVNEPKYMLSDILDTMILNLQKNHGLKPGEIIYKPIAFVITKTDLIIQSGGTVLNNEEKFILENGEELFLNKIKRNFLNYRFFTIEEKSKEQQSVEVIKWIAAHSTIATH
jgi:ribosomal protein L40E